MVSHNLEQNIIDGEKTINNCLEGQAKDREIHEWAYDPKNGGGYTFVSKPTVVMGLFGKSDKDGIIMVLPSSRLKSCIKSAMYDA